MKENVLKKDFKKQDVERIRNLVQGKYGEKTRSSVGFSKKDEFHQEGDIWESDGRTWTIKNGIRQNVTKLDKAKKAEEHFDNIVVGKGIPKNIKEIQVQTEELVVNVIFNARLLKSKGEVRRMIKQNAVKINGKLITNINEKIQPRKDYVIKVGKRRFLRINN